MSQAVFVAQAGQRKEKMDDMVKEVQLLSKLPHPNIIRVHGVMNTQEHFGTVYEYCKGKDLFSSLTLVGPRKEDECVRYFAQIVLAISKIHERGIFHGNLDSRHILFKNEMGSKDQVLKLSGFATTDTVENADYLPPEVILNHDNYSQAADVWSLGVILLQMATGIERPFNTSRFKKFQEGVETGVHRKLYLKEHKFTPAFVALLDGCFQLDKDDRWKINRIIGQYAIMMQINQWVPGAIFPTFWHEGRSKLITVDEQFGMSRAEIDLATIEKEFHDYKKEVTVAKLRKNYQDHMEAEAVAKEERVIAKGQLMDGIGVLTEELLWNCIHFSSATFDGYMSRVAAWADTREEERLAELERQRQLEAERELERLQMRDMRRNIAMMLAKGMKARNLAAK